MEKDAQLMEKIVSLAKRRGFIYPGSDIYGGLAGTFDYGHFGVALKDNIKNSWKKKFVKTRKDMFEVDAAILMNGKVWETSGHVGGFSDPLVEDLVTNKRYRADHILENAGLQILKRNEDFFILDKNKTHNFEREEMFTSLMLLKYKNDLPFNISDYLNSSDSEKVILITNEIIKLYKISSPEGNEFGDVRQFNMMFQTKIGAVEDSSAIAYLRPETAQGMFVNFKNIMDSMHPKLPFGMAQIGKAFRNEITPRDFIFRVREFEQMEIEYFIRPELWEAEFNYWKDEMVEWMNSIGIDSARVHELEVEGTDLAHYSKRTVDFEFDFPFGKKELYGLAYRGSYDLGVHQEASGVSLEYFDEETKERFIPHVIEPSFGLDRTVLALLTSAYTEVENDGEVRSFLKFKPSIAPNLACVSPLLKNKEELVHEANAIYATLKQTFGTIAWDDNGNIGKRYRRQDEIGTPYCIVVDFDTLEDGTITVRDRDSGTQVRMHKDEVEQFLRDSLEA